MKALKNLGKNLHTSLIAFFVMLSIFMLLNDCFLSGISFLIAALLITPKFFKLCKISLEQKGRKTGIGLVFIFLVCFGLTTGGSKIGQMKHEEFVQNKVTLTADLKRLLEEKQYAAAFELYKSYEGSSDIEFEKLGSQAKVENDKILEQERLVEEEKDMAEQKVRDELKKTLDEAALYRKEMRRVKKSSQNYNAEAWVYCQTVVEQSLKSPKSADFPWMDPANIQVNGAFYTINSYVDAQNSFGAEIRTRYLCQIERNEQINGWNLKDLKFTNND